MAKEQVLQQQQQQQKMSATNESSAVSFTSIDKRSKSPLLGFFWDLVSKKPNVRHEVTYKMLKFLEQTQKAHRSSDSETESLDSLLSEFHEYFSSYSIENTGTTRSTLSSPESESEAEDEDFQEDAEKCQEFEKVVFSADIVYSLKRLVRGLPSSREAARQGFALALSELLGMLLGSVPLGYILHLIHSNLKITGGMKGEEEKDVYLGILFGYMAIVKSGILLKNPESRLISEMLNSVLRIAQNKSFLSELCAQIIADIAESLKDTASEDNNSQLMNFIVNRLNSDAEDEAKCKLFGQGETPEAIFIYLKLSKIYPVS